MTDGLIINGARYPVPGVRVITYLDDPRVPKAAHGAPRKSTDVIASIVHTSRGKDARITRETGSPAKGLRVARYLGRSNSRQVSAHLVVAGDGTVYQIADLGAWRCNHAGAVNGWTWGLEAAQDDDDPSLTRAQVNALVAVMHAAHDALNIPKRLPMIEGHHVVEDVRPWISRGNGGQGKRFSGACGHRCVSVSRGKGDPGDAIMEALRASGFVGATPAEMTTGPTTLREAATIGDTDEMHDGDDAPAWPPLPAWIDPALEVDASEDLPDDLAAFARAQAPVLAALGVTGDHAAELIAHAATECGRGRRAVAHNLGGVKAREGEFTFAAAKGVPLGWWRDLGHVDAGDAEVVYYRAFADDAEFWRYFSKRFLPRDAPASERYAALGRVFWSADPSGFAVELLRSGYRGEVREREVAALADPNTHPSVVAHRRLVATVKGLL